MSREVTIEELYGTLKGEKTKLDKLNEIYYKAAHKFKEYAITSRLVVENRMLHSRENRHKVTNVQCSSNRVLLSICIVNRYDVTMFGWLLCLNVQPTRIRIWAAAPDKDVGVGKLYFQAIPELKPGQQFTIDLNIENPYLTSVATFTFCLMQSSAEKPVKTHVVEHVMHVFDAMVSYGRTESEKRLSLKDYACMASFKPRLGNVADPSKPLTCSFCIANDLLEDRQENESLESYVLRVFIPFSDLRHVNDGYLVLLDDKNHLMVSVTPVVSEERVLLSFDVYGVDAEYAAQALTEVILWRISALVSSVTLNSKPVTLKALRRAVKVTLPWKGDWTKNCYINPPNKT